MSQMTAKVRSDYFAEGDYVVTDPGKGVMRSRAGTRMVALTEDFLRGLREALDSECGPGADLVLRTCGRAWGADFARRVEKELSEFHGKPLQSEPLGSFEASLTSLFSHHGWGATRFDFTQHARGLIVVAVRDPVLAAAAAAASKRPATRCWPGCWPAPSPTSPASRSTASRPSAGRGVPTTAAS